MKTGYFLTKEQEEVLQDVIAEKLEEDYAKHSVLHPVFEQLIGRWMPTYKEEPNE
jgi:hypothetical protein